MDKFTVDLDQVLNDFEYSELTDHCEPQPSFQQLNYNNHKNTNVKHSINNVFHSLNEYLNSEIGESCSSESSIKKSNFNCNPNKSYNNNSCSSSNEPVDIYQKNNQIETIDGELSQSTETKLETERNDQTIEGKSEEVVEKNEETTKSELKPETIENEPEIVQSEFDLVDVVQIPIDLVDVVQSSVDLREVVQSNIEVVQNEIQVETDSDETASIKSFENEQNGGPSQIHNLKQKAIGFTNELPIDENELNQYLEDIEQEFDNNNKTIEEAQINQQLIRPNNLELSSESSSSIINLVGEPGSTPYNNLYVTSELPIDTSNKTFELPVDICAETFELPVDTNKEKIKTVENSVEVVHNASVEFESNSETIGQVDTIVNSNELLEEKSELLEEKSELLENTNELLEVTNELLEKSELLEEKNELPAQDDETSSASLTFSDVSTDTTCSLSPVNDETMPTPSIEPPNVEIQSQVGEIAPIWIPDADALNCQHCEQKFTVLKRRHHCRACGFVLCSKCCNLRHFLAYLNDISRVCTRCYDTLSKIQNGSDRINFQPNPSNPLEYCSTISPSLQASGQVAPPSVLVPVGVLKRNGGNKKSQKSVMFCDGIRPGSDLINLDCNLSITNKMALIQTNVKRKSHPNYSNETKSYIPSGINELPPILVRSNKGVLFTEPPNLDELIMGLRTEAVTFCLQVNLNVQVKIVNLDCCINKIAWCFTTDGLINVGQDELVYVLEMLENETIVPIDLFHHINQIYHEACNGQSVKEFDLSLHQNVNFFGSKNHAGFVYVRPTFQCMQNLLIPHETYLIGVLIHRWETPWAKLFPLRLILRLGAEYRYYPNPIISNRYRDSVYVEIGHTIINLLADFRNYTYSLPQIRGLTILMEEKQTTVSIPKNRYDQVIKAMSNSSEHILAFAGHFSTKADSHLVCIQDTQSNDGAYNTHAINIHNKPKKITGASFIVFNGALKSSSGLTAKSSIVEDGLMIQIPAEQMLIVRENLRNMKNYSISCGSINATSEECVRIVWDEADVCFNLGVRSPIDSRQLEGVPSIRVHNAKDFVNGTRLIRWTEVFIIEDEIEGNRNQDPIDISKVSEIIANASCAALVKYLELLVTHEFYKVGIRVNLGAFAVSYTAGSNATKLPPIYMESLDNELVPILHRYANNDCDDNKIVLELLFRILNK